jgi:hypothetical protein
MSLARSFLAILLCYAVALPGFAQTPQISGERPRGLVNWFANDYTGQPITKATVAECLAQARALRKELRALLVSERPDLLKR